VVCERSSVSWGPDKTPHHPNRGGGTKENNTQGGGEGNDRGRHRYISTGTNRKGVENNQGKRGKKATIDKRGRKVNRGPERERGEGTKGREEKGRNRR